MSQTIRFFTKKMLAKMNTVAVKRGYNRAFKDDFVSSLPDSQKFPVIFHFVHSHKKGVECEPHVRVVIAFGANGDKDCLDCDWKLFYDLPTVTLSNQPTGR